MNTLPIKYIFLLWLTFFAYASFAQNKDSLRFDKSIINKQLSIIKEQGTGNNQQRTGNNQQRTRNKEQETVVFLFLDTECPMCQKYTLKISAIDSICRLNQISLIGIFTDKNIKKQAIENFKNKYNLKIQTFVDKNLALAKALKASTTPEVFLVDRVGERIAYRGLIDDWFYMLGRSRKEAAEHYLINAINAFLKKQEINIKKTNPIGCLIQY